MTLPIRPVSVDEYDAFARVIEHAFAGPPDPDEVHAVERDLLEFDRTLAAFDGDEPVATAAAYSFRMTVPGGTALPTAGVTWVGVLPTHRRRGLLTRLMRRQLDDIRAAGREPIAALWASESPIYGRYGYGLASSAMTMAVPHGHHRLHDVPGTADLRARLVDTGKSVDLVQPVYDRQVMRRPGMLALETDTWRNARIFDPESRRDGASPLRTLLVEDTAGRLRGYARYATKQSWDRSGPAGTAVVHELEALDPAAAAAAWRYLLNLDLITTTRMRNRPTDDPLRYLLVDPRRAQPELGDALYVRVVDVVTALRARTYAVPVESVIEVADPFCPWNAGRWRLTAYEAEVECERTDAPADISLDVRELGACYLGGTSLHALADAGLVTEHTPGTVSRLSAAFRHEPAPWCPFVF
ncbi:MAG TPA: GNAT family N-acetyltransferase [Nocardioidaceae bacterium]|nr:GNAT family N-acetyltransferase [Nocardioidaceae bacterium]